MLQRFPRVSQLFVLALVTLLLGALPIRARATESTASPPPSSSNESASGGTPETLADASPAEQANPQSGRLAAASGPPPLEGDQPASNLGAPQGSDASNVALASVEPSTGAANASIPFEMPRARGQVSARLGLSYSSMSGTGEGGHGWSLSMASIQRSNRSNGPRYWDPAVGEAIDPAVVDQFVLGNQALVPICLLESGNCTNGTALQPGEVVSHDFRRWMYYRPQIDDGYTRAFWSDDHRTWIIQNRGVTREYGIPLDDPDNTGGVDLDAVTKPEAPTIFRWNLVREYSAEGKINAIVYDWKKLGPHPHALGYLSDIYQTPMSRLVPNFSRYQFAQHARLVYSEDNSEVGFFLGAAVWRQKPRWRLDHVDITSFDNDPGFRARHLIRRYKLQYRIGEHFAQARSMLARVLLSPACDVLEDNEYRLPGDLTERCGSETRLVSEMTYFGHEAPRVATGSDHAGRQYVYEKDDSISFADLDADGRADYMRRRASDASMTVQLSHPVLGALAPVKMLIQDGDIVRPAHDTIFGRVSKRGDWNHDGKIGAFQAAIPPDPQPVPDNPRWSFFVPSYDSGSQLWLWAGGSHEGYLSDWRDGVPSPKPTEPGEFADLDGDGYLDRFSLQPVYNSSGIIGHTVSSFLSTASNNLDPRGLVQAFKLHTNTTTLIEPYLGPEASLWLLTHQVFSDVTGDGIPDLARTYEHEPTEPPRPREKQTWVWPGRGNGYLETEPQKMGGISQSHRQDLNGDQRTDFIDVSPEDASVYVRFGGTSQSLRVEGLPVDETTELQFADIGGFGVNSIIAYSRKRNAIGTAAIVPNPPGGGVAGPVRAGLLHTISNGVGTKTTLTYEVRYSAREPHHVKMIETTSNADRRTTGGPFVTTFFHSGSLWDGRERRFRGFRTVEKEELGPPNGRIKTTFLLADCPDVNPAGPCSSNFNDDDEHKPLAGKPVLIEQGNPHWPTSEGRVVSTRHHTYRLRKLYTGMDGRSVRDAYVERTDTWLYDPAHAATASQPVAIKDFIRDGSLGHEEPAPDRELPLWGTLSSGMAHLVAETKVDGLGRKIKATDFGTVEGGHGIDSPIVETTVWALPAGDPTTWNWKPVDVTVGDGANSKHRRFEYDSAGHIRRTFGELKGTLPLVRFHEDSTAQVAPTPADASQDATELLLSEVEHDGWGNPVLVKGPNGRCSSTTFDSVFHALAEGETVYTNGCGGPGLTSTTKYDRGFEVPTMVVRPNGAVSTTSYDGYGRPVELFEPDPDLPGITEVVPNTKIRYVDVEGGPYQMTVVEQRDDDGSSHRYRTTATWQDPFGNVAAVAREVDPTAGDAARHIVGGVVERDQRGLVVRQYEPYFANVDIYRTTPPAIPANLPYKSASYDTLGRALLANGIDGRPILKMAYHALSADAFDAADLAEAATPHPTTTVRDGHGRTTKTIRTTHQGGTLDTLVTQMTYLATGEMATLVRSHSASSDVYMRRMRYDSFGRLVENAEPNTSTDFGGANMKAWRYAFNDAGDLVGTSDARGCGKNVHSDTAGRLLSETYSPCSSTHAPFEDRPATLYIYDAPEEGQEEVGASPQFFIGELAAVYDRAQRARYTYDARGRTTHVARQIALPADGEQVGVRAAAGASGEEMSSLQAGYAPHWYKSSAVYDTADRVLARTAGADVAELLGRPVTVGALSGRDLITTSYSARGIAHRVGGSYGDVLTRKTVDADGRVRSMTFGDVAETTATYDYDARRNVKQALVRRNPPSIWETPPAGYTKPSPTETAQTVLQDLRFDSYDPDNNPLLAGDARPATEWPAGAKPITRQFSYDDLNQLRRVDYESGGDTHVSPHKAETANYDDMRPIPEQPMANRVRWQSFEFDWQGNLVKTDDDAHAFHDRSMGTIAHGTATNGPNRITSASGERGHGHASYDAAGNLTGLILSKNGPDGDAIDIEFSYEWDEIGQLVWARRARIRGIPFDWGVDFRYTYNAGGQRITKSVEDPRTFQRAYSHEIFSTLRLNNAPFGFGDYERTKETETVYLVSNGSAFGRVVYGSDELPTIGGNRQHVYFTITDPLGSTSVVIDKATSELVERNTYLAFGQAESDYRPERWESFREDYRFTGKEDDVGVGLTYFGARYYAPALGHWASADPLTIHGMGSDLNPYAYVLGSPQRLVDPDGLQQADPGGGPTPCGGGWCTFVEASETYNAGGVPGGGGGRFWVPGSGSGQPYNAHVPFFEVNTFYEISGKIVPPPPPTAEPLPDGMEEVTVRGKPREPISIEIKGAMVNGQFKVLSFSINRNQVGNALIKMGEGTQRAAFAVAMATLALATKGAGPRRLLATTGGRAFAVASVGEAVGIVEAAVAVALSGVAMLSQGGEGANPKSVKQFGHTFSRHGAGAKNTANLKGRAAGTGQQQGQWLDNQAAADFLSGLNLNGNASVRIPEGLGQAIMPNGSIAPANWARVILNGASGVETAFPFVVP